MAKVGDREGVEDWLKNRSRGVAIAVAARSTLRVVPLLYSAFDPQAERRLPSLTFAVFRALSVARCASKGAMAAHEVRAAACHSAGVSHTDNNIKPADDVADAAAHAAYAAAGDEPANAASYAVDAAARQLEFPADVWVAVFHDAQFLEVEAPEARDPAERLAELWSSPLWHNEVPAWVNQHWQPLKAHLLAANDCWEIWTDWYEDCLYGRRRSEVLELAIAAVPEADWQKGPAHANPIIKRLIEEHRCCRERGGVSGLA